MHDEPTEAIHFEATPLQHGVGHTEANSLAREEAEWCGLWLTKI